MTTFLSSVLHSIEFANKPADVVVFGYTVVDIPNESGWYEGQ